MWLIAAFFLILLSGMAILWPYWRPQVALGPTADVDPRLVDLYAQRDKLYQAVRDARLDLQTGKLSTVDFEQHEAGLKQRAAEVLRAIDQVEADLLSPQLDASLEAEIAAARLGPGADDHAVEASIAAVRRSRQGGVAKPVAVAADRFCGHCGGPLQVGDRFCGKCGQAVRAA
jgi:hypothetical protein